MSANYDCVRKGILCAAYCAVYIERSLKSVHYDNHFKQ